MLPRHYKTENLAPVIPSRAMLHERAVAWAEEEFARRYKIPFLWLIAVRTEILWLETPWEDIAEKRAMQAMIAALIERFDAHAFAFMSEAWVAVKSYEVGHEPKPEDIPSLEDLPENERDDVMMITSEDRAGTVGMTRYLVSIRPNGRHSLGPRVDEADQFEGALFSMFKRGARP